MDPDSKGKKKDSSAKPTAHHEPTEAEKLLVHRRASELPPVLLPKFSKATVQSKHRLSSNGKFSKRRVRSRETMELKEKVPSRGRLKKYPSNGQVPEKLSDEAAAAVIPSNDEDKDASDKGPSEVPSTEGLAYPKPEMKVSYDMIQDDESKGILQEKRSSHVVQPRRKSFNRKRVIAVKKSPSGSDVELEEVTAQAASSQLINHNLLPTNPFAEQKTPMHPSSKGIPQQKNFPSRTPSVSQPQKNKTVGFFKAVYRKTKFWGRKSDCVLEPTKEMLAKSYVRAEYHMDDPDEFRPETREFMKEVPNGYFNSNSAKDKIFLNNSPFWLTRLPTDTFPPKAKVQIHRQLKLAVQGNPSVIFPKMPKRESLLDPLKDDIEKLVAVNQKIGVDLPEIQKRVMSNTFHSTLMFESEKIEAEKRKLAESKKLIRKNSAEKRECSKNLTFSIPTNQILYAYNRKARPQIYRGGTKREFQKFQYVLAEKKAVKKSSPNSNMSHQEPKKQ
uniref:Uncharacterized protein n=1 Tax=Caenorhabditis japonica TaxID=281687 RepID=A0A8R1HMY4_CAEJA